MEAILQELDTFYKQVPPADIRHLNEVEFRLAYGTSSNIGVIDFDRLLKRYKTLYGEPVKNILLTLIDGASTIRLVGLDKIKTYLLSGQPDTDALYYTKKKQTFSFADHPLRISFGTETPVKPFTLGNRICFRYAQRFTFQVSPGCTIDFTVTRQATAPNIKIAGVLDVKCPENYEIELEFQDYKPGVMRAPLERLLTEYYGGLAISGLSELTAVLNGYIGLCNTVLRPEPCLPERVETCIPFLWHGKDGKYYANDIAAKFYYDIVPDISEIFQPEHIASLIPSETYVTDKADGRRALLYTWHGNFYLLYKSTLKMGRLIQTALTVIPTGTASILAEGSLYDGEFLMVNQAAFYLCFDVLTSGQLIGKQVPFQSRLAHLNATICNGIIVPGLNIGVKKFTPMSGNFQKELNLQNDTEGHLIRVLDVPQITYRLDGLIFQNMYGVYPVPGTGEKWLGTMKWKPPGEVTIDFKIIAKHVQPEQWQVVLAYGQHNTACKYKGYVPLDRQGIPRVQEDNAAVSVGDIVECRLIPATEKGVEPYWLLMRLRRDKNAPNGEQTYVSNMAAISQQLSLADIISGRTGKSISELNPMHAANKVNRRLSNQHIYNYAKHVRNGRLFELAVGAAQSSSAWKFAGLKEILGIDIDVSKVADSDAYLKRGNRDVKTSYFTWDMCEPLEKHPVISVITEKYDLAVCNFAIHYAFRSEASFGAFCKNVTRYLKNGAYFVGTYMSLGEIQKLPVKSETIPGYIYNNDGKSVSVKSTSGETVWAIKSTNEPTQGIFGKQIEVDIFERPLSAEYFIDLADDQTQQAFQNYGLTYVPTAESSSPLEQFKVNLTELNPFEQRWINIHRPFVFRYQEKAIGSASAPKLRLKRKLLPE